MKKYYILEWNDYCWDSFLQYQIDILECYKMKNYGIKIMLRPHIFFFTQ